MLQMITDGTAGTTCLEWPCFASSRDSAPCGRKTVFKTTPRSLGREMIEWASTADEKLFPSLVHHLCDVDILLAESSHKELLVLAPNIAVTLERISRILDPNQRGQARTIFLSIENQEKSFVSIQAGTLKRVESSHNDARDVLDRSGGFHYVALEPHFTHILLAVRVNLT